MAAEPRLPAQPVKELLKDGHSLRLGADALREARLWADAYLEVLGSVASRYAKQRGSKTVQAEDIVAAKDHLNANGYRRPPDIPG